MITENAYRDDAIAGNQGENVSAGDSVWADGLHCRFDVVHDIKTSDGIVVGSSSLLPRKSGRVNEEN